MEVISGAVFSDAGQFAFAVAVSFVLVAFSLFVAYQQAQYVTGIPDRVKFQGRKPTRASSIKRRLDIVKGFRSQLLLRVLVSLVIVVATGVFVPAAALFLLLTQAVHYFPDSALFVTGGACATGEAVSSPGKEQLALFVLAQSYSALALDSFHGFIRPPSTQISAAETSALMSTLTATYKLYLGGYAGNWVRTVAYGFFNLLFRSKEQQAQVQELQAQYDDAVSRENGS